MGNHVGIFIHFDGGADDETLLVLTGDRGMGPPQSIDFRYNGVIKMIYTRSR